MKTTKLISGLLGGMIPFAPLFTASAETLDGKTLFQKKMCFACHGKDGQGGPAGPSLKNLGKCDEELTEFLKKGSAKMRPFKGTDEELKAIVNYILSLQ